MNAARLFRTLLGTARRAAAMLALSAAAAGAWAQTASTTSLAVSPNPAMDSQEVTLAVTVSGSQPGGLVVLKDGNTVLVTRHVDEYGNVHYVQRFTVGTHNLTAAYNGDANNKASSSAGVVLNVYPPGSTTSVSSSTNPSTYGTSVSFTANVTASKALKGGTVTFFDGGVAFGAAALSSAGRSGTATVVAPVLNAGTHAITASYGGDSLNPASTSAVLSQQVNRASTTTAVSVSPSPGTFGQPVTFTASVNGGGPVRTGSVTFSDGSNVLGSATIDSGGSASLTIPSLAAGQHPVTASYGGDANNLGSTSPTTGLTINKAATSTSVSSAPNPSIFGNAVTIAATVSGPAPTGTVTFSDGGTPIGSAAVNGGVATLVTSGLIAGSHAIVASYSGDANQLASTSAAAAQTVNQAPTTTTLASSANPAAPGSSITLTATITGPAPTGNVSFSDGATVLGVVTLAGSGSSRTAAFTLANPGPGLHNLSAQYGGDANHLSSGSTQLAQVVQAASSASVASSLNPANYGQPVVVTAAVSGYQPTGTVSFTDAGTVLGTATLTGSGNTATAALTLGSLAVGSHAITVSYGGDTYNTASSSTALTQTVNPAPTTTSVAASQNPATYGQGVTWTATVAAGVNPSGTVRFSDGATVLGTVTLANGTASFSSSALGAGSHNIIAAYSGDTNNAASASAAVAQTINQASTTTAVGASANPSTYGQSVTWTATVTGVNATGSVSFKDGSATLGTAILSNGTATFASSMLAGGAHSITAAYSGDSNNAASVSAALAQTITALATTTSLSANANPASFGQSVTFTAAVQGASPSGTVAFSDGATLLGTASLSNGAASFSTSQLAAGAHGITAAYSGDANNAPSSSQALAETVNGSSTTTLSANPAVANIGASITFTATVTGPGSAVPTGTVTFSEGAATLGSAMLANGSASLSVGSLVAGSHTVTATYAGDANTPASSGTASVTVSNRGPYSWQYGYDAMGRLNTQVDPNNQGSYFYYDSLGRRIQSRQPANSGSSTPTLTSFGWDLQDQLVSVTDPRSLTTSYAPDGLGNVKSEASPDRGNSGYTYDAKGNVLTSTDARGKTTSFSYDSLDRVTSISYPTGVPTNFEYDGGATPTPSETGELTRITDESGQTQYVHDAIGRLTSKTTTIAGKSFVVAYGWGDSGSALDKLTSITYPSGTRVNYGYDSAGFVNAITLTPTGGAQQTLLTNITYNQENAPTGWQWSDGKARTIGYDSVGVIASYTLGDPNGTGNAAGSLRTLVRDSAARITGYLHTNNGQSRSQLDQSFAYDNLNRLTVDAVNGASIAYTYDATGNRTSKVVGGTTYANTVAANSNRLIQTQDVTGSASVQYDLAGHVTGDGSNTYAYNDRGRMTSATTPSGAVNFLYNGLNQRAYKASSLGTSYYVYDEAGQLLGEYAASGNSLYETVYFGSTPVGAIKLGAVYNVHADQIDTPRVITKQDQTIVWRWDTAEAFGATAPDNDPSGLGAFTYNQRFPGQVFDAETGLNQNWNREYDARIGRYKQVDPIGLRGGINTFGYVEGNPVQYVDPLGYARQGGKTGQWWEFTDRNFQRWFHRCVKQAGDPDATREELADAYAQWVEYGKPDGKSGCGGPPPTPTPTPAPSCEDCKKVAKVVVVGGTAYIIYRCIRMIPSLFPPLWPTVLPNVVTP